MTPGLRSGDDSWFKKYEDVKQLASDILAQIQERNSKLADGGGDSSRITSGARRNLGRLGTAIDVLSELLESAECAKLSEVEKNVRRDMISTLRLSKDQMQQALRRDGHAQRRSTLLETTSSGPSDAAQETRRTADLNNQGLMQMQRDIIKEQDQELADLEATVGSTKHIALTINDELGLQERLLDELDEDVDVSQSRLKAAQKKLNKVMRQSGNCKSLLLIVGLMVILAIVLVIGFKLISFIKHF